jgi:hypothetical protein
MATAENLKSGTIDISDVHSLEQLDVRQLVDELSAAFPERFLERRIADKWEVGLAKAKAGHRLNRCILLTSESGQLTTVAMMAFVEFRPSVQNAAVVDISSGGGFSLYRTPDGWKTKLLEEKTVSLATSELAKRGWLIT